MRWWLPISLAACGGGASSKTQHSMPPAVARAPTVSASAMRERAKAFCGPKYQTVLEGSHEGKPGGCDWVEVTGGRGKLAVDLTGDTIALVQLTIIAKEADAEAARTTASAVVQDMFDAPGRATVKTALERLYKKGPANVDNGGWIGDQHIRASTEIDVAKPTERWIELRVQLARSGDGQDRPPLAKTPRPEELASPARAVTDVWLADAKATCTEMSDAVLKSHKAAVAPAKWEQGELHVACTSPDENSVGQFVVTWAPGTRQLLYATLVVELPQKKFSALADRLFTPLLTAGQWSVARSAAKKALDHKLEAEGLQIGSRHDSGGFFGETHELEISVQVGYKP